jgi:hypothetical protein
MGLLRADSALGVDPNRPIERPSRQNNKIREGGEEWSPQIIKHLFRFTSPYGRGFRIEPRDPIVRAELQRCAGSVNLVEATSLSCGDWLHDGGTPAANAEQSLVTAIRL